MPLHGPALMKPTLYVYFLLASVYSDIHADHIDSAIASVYSGGHADHIGPAIA